MLVSWATLNTSGCFQSHTDPLVYSIYHGSGFQENVCGHVSQDGWVSVIEKVRGVIAWSDARWSASKGWAFWTRKNKGPKKAALDREWGNEEREGGRACALYLGMKKKGREADTTVIWHLLSKMKFILERFLENCKLLRPPLDEHWCFSFSSDRSLLSSGIAGFSFSPQLTKPATISNSPQSPNGKALPTLSNSYVEINAPSSMR